MNVDQRNTTRFDYSIIMAGIWEEKTAKN